MKAKVKDEASYLMLRHLLEVCNPKFRVQKEYQFCAERRWRFDFCIQDQFGVEKIAIEIDGGMWIQGRHTRGSGQMKDNEKFNNAARLGWRVLKFSPKEVLDGSAIAFIRKVLES